MSVREVATERKTASEKGLVSARACKLGRLRQLGWRSNPTHLIINPPFVTWRNFKFFLNDKGWAQVPTMPGPSVINITSL